MYTKVLNIEASNKHALNGLMALGTTTSAHLDPPRPGETGENDDESGNSSRMKTNDDDDDSELVWSDVEMDTA